MKTKRARLPRWKRVAGPYGPAWARFSKREGKLMDMRYKKLRRKSRRKTKCRPSRVPFKWSGRMYNPRGFKRFAIQNKETGREWRMVARTPEQAWEKFRDQAFSASSLKPARSDYAITDTRESVNPRRRKARNPQADQVRGVRTDVFKHGDEGRVIYRGTTVVYWDSSKIFLDTGGWKSATTKLRMNQASNQFGLGYGVYAKGGKWYVSYRGRQIPFTGNVLELSR